MDLTYITNDMTNIHAGRIVYIDNIKGFAIILVVLAHIAEKFYKFDIYPDYTDLFEAIYRIIYYFHMPLFMILSGKLFVTAYIRNNKIEKKRFWIHWIDLAIVYFVISILTGFAKMIFADDLIHPFSRTDILLIPFKPIGHTWYLYILLLLYLFAYWVYNHEINRYKRVGVFLLIVLCFASYYVQEDYLVVQRLMQYGLYFAFGMVFIPDMNNAHHNSLVHMVLYRIIPITGVIMLILKYCFYHYSEGNIQLKWASLIIALGCSLFFIELFAGLRGLQKESLLSEIGSCSLEIYLFHQFLVSLLIKIFIKVGIRDGIASCAIILVGTIAIIYIGINILKKINIYDYFLKPYTAWCKKREKIQ